jgi:HK97 family phage portal protein
VSILSQVFSPKFRAADVKQISNVFGGFPLFSTSATLATSKSALTLSAFYNAIDILSDDIAKLPKHIFVKEGKNRSKDQSHQLNYLLSVRPNGKMTPFTFWKTVEALRLTKGNCYVQKQINPNTGQEIAWHIRSNEDVKVYEDADQLWYQYKGKVYPSSDWLHFKGFSDDGKIGIGVVSYAAKSLGVALENQEYGQTIYKNRGMSYGVLETDLSVEGTNKKAIESAFSSKLATKEIHNVALLDEGFKYKSIAITPAEAQFLETNKNGILEVCRWLNIAPHLLKDLTQANYSNIYQQSIEHVQLSVLPRVISKEQELNYKCLSQKEQTTHYIKFNVASLLRGDLDAKAKYYTAGIYAGYYTRNEVRDLEDLNPITGLDEPLQPVNMQALSVAAQLLKEQANGDK